MDSGTSDRPVGARALVGSADIARLAGVRRPAVSNWRRRFADFPAPVAGSSSQPLFALEEVRAWCREHDRPFEAEGADLVWQRVRAEVPDVRRAEFLAYLGQVLTEDLPVPSPTPGVPEEWGGLARELLSGEDPDKDYEELCGRLAGERGRAETDPVLARWMAELGGIDEGTKVAVPACGVGTLLVAALARGATEGFAQDRDPFAWRVATTRLHLGHGNAVCLTDAEDSLRDEDVPYGRFDVVLCDPPFRDREWGHEELADDPRWVYGVPPRSEGELAWVQHCLSLARPGGRVVVLLPASVSYRPSGRRIRASLLRAGALRAVLEVPREGPAQAAGRQVWILIRPQEGADTDGRILLVGEAEPTDSVRAWEDFLAGVDMDRDPRRSVLDVSSLIDEEVDLRPARYLDRARKTRASVHYPPLLTEFTDTLEQARSLVEDLTLSPVEEVPETTVGALLDEGALELHRAPLALDTGAGEVPVLTVRDVRSGEAPSGRCTRVPGLVMALPGDVVVAETVRETPVRVITEPGTALGPRLVLLRPVEGRIDAAFLSWVLHPRCVASVRTSSGRADVRALRLPVLSLERQRAHARVWERLARNAHLTERITELGARLAELGDRALREGGLGPRAGST
ncbi:N-6 DNA methylase [Nocardiopsis sp. ATB16-24]|uniref:HsdM family class I SAM-dependent methyltransferase n=1 Tax=Nocardiopsis sp. ATB16-24 TaxID=3019555 RepID=UPI0025535EDA|nr:N-6 DNA methylase [Nocardiopsis sp. ATB16-24]